MPRLSELNSNGGGWRLLMMQDSGRWNRSFTHLHTLCERFHGVQEQRSKSSCKRADQCLVLTTIYLLAIAAVRPSLLAAEGSNPTHCRSRVTAPNESKASNQAASDSWQIQNFQSRRLRPHIAVETSTFKAHRIPPNRHQRISIPS